MVLQSILIIVIGAAVGWAVGRLMEPTVRATRTSLALGAFGAVAATGLARWAGVDGTVPAGAISSTRAEVQAGVRAWWNGDELATAVARDRSGSPRPSGS